MTTAEYLHDGETRTVSYRQVVAMLLPALLLSYTLLISPLIYGRGAVSADLASGLPPATVDFALNKIFFPGTFALAVVLYLAERPLWSRDTAFVMVALGLFLGYCATSSLWSIVPSRTISQLVLATMVLATIGLATQVAGATETMFRSLFLLFALTLAINLASVVLTAAGPIGHQGIYPHKNGLGAVAALGLMMAFYGIGKRGMLRLIGLGMIPVALYILWKSQSKTSLGLALMVPFIAGALWLAMRYLRISLTVGFVLAGIVAALLVAMLGTLGYGIGDASLLIGDDPTFTGRTEIWAFAAEQIANHPLLGHGFRSFWGIGADAPQLHAPPGFVRVTPHGHNGYVDLLLELGAVGLGLFALVYVGAIARINAIARYFPAIGFSTLCLILYIGLQNLLESSWLEPLDASTVLFAVILFAPISQWMDRR